MSLPVHPVPGDNAMATDPARQQEKASRPVGWWSSLTQMLLSPCSDFTSLFHLQLLPMYGARHWSNFILLHVDLQFSQHHLLETLSFLQLMFWAFVSNIKWLSLHALMFGSLVFFHSMSVLVTVSYSYYYCGSLIS